MPDRKGLVRTLLLTTSLALLTSVLVAPIRMSGFVSVSSRPDCPRRNSALALGQPHARLNAAMATENRLRVNALPSENKEQDRADALGEPPETEEKDWANALDQPRVSFRLPASFRKAPDRQLIAPPPNLSLSPLRC